MISPLIAYDAAGNIVATLDHLTARDEDGNVTGLVDFEAHELAGKELTDIWTVEDAVGSGTWPEWLGAQAHDFKVELAGSGQRHKILGLTHRRSGFQRSRGEVMQRINDRKRAAGNAPADIRDIVGGPTKPLLLDANGRNRPRLRSLTAAMLPVMDLKGSGEG